MTAELLDHNSTDSPIHPMEELALPEEISAPAAAHSDDIAAEPTETTGAKNENLTEEEKWLAREVIRQSFARQYRKNVRRKSIIGRRSVDSLIDPHRLHIPLSTRHHHE